MFVNTKYFSPVAMDGYTQAPEGSYEWVEYWTEQRRRCIEGYSVGGVSITGRHYHYLNFWPIRRTVEGYAGKRKALPSFLDIDYEFYHELEKARALGKDFMVLKRRQIGFSWKSSQLLGYEFSFVPNSQSLLVSGVETYSKQTMRMVLGNLDHAFNTPFYKNRLPNEEDFIQAAFKETDPESGAQRLTGYMSTLERLTASNIQVLIGKSPSLVVHEEMGKYKGIKDVKLYIDAGLEEAGKRTGMQILIGTGGEDHTSIEEVADMFYKPHLFNLMEYDNVFDEQAMEGGTKKGKIAYFVPGDYFTDARDEEGNSHREKAREIIIARRNKVLGDKKAWTKEVTQYPLTPEEALMSKEGNVFDVAMLREQRARILKSTELQERVRIVSIDWKRDVSGNIIGAEWRVDPENGIFRMVEPPAVDAMNEPVRGLYVMGTDSYDKDKAADPKRASLGAARVWKLWEGLDQSDDLPVCGLFQRPDTSEEFFENTAKMAVLYGWAQNLIEWSNITIFNWYRHNGFGHLLRQRPEVAYAHMSKSQVQNRDGIDPNTRHVWVEMAQNWIHKGGAYKIWDLQLLDKLIRYNGEDNCDETDAFMIAILHKNDIPRVNREKVEEKPFLPRRYGLRGGKLVRL